MTLRPEGDSRKNASQKGTSPQVLSPVREIPLIAETHFSKYAEVFFLLFSFFRLIFFVNIKTINS